MYAYLKGQIMQITLDSCVIDVNNIGYNVLISSSTAQRLPGIGEIVTVYTYTSVKEDSINLIGFLDADELNMFRKLITVNSIGPKAALSILSVMNADAVRFAILTGDVNSLSKAPGVGKRSAERIIIDLKGKVDAEEMLIPKVSDNVSAGGYDSELIKDATEALTALGYGTTEALKAVRSITITDDMDVNDILKLSLKELI